MMPTNLNHFTITVHSSSLLTLKMSYLIYVFPKKNHFVNLSYHTFQRHSLVSLEIKIQITGHIQLFRKSNIPLKWPSGFGSFLGLRCGWYRIYRSIKHCPGQKKIVGHLVLPSFLKPGPALLILLIFRVDLDFGVLFPVLMWFNISSSSLPSVI